MHLAAQSIMEMTLFIPCGGADGPTGKPWRVSFYPKFHQTLTSYYAGLQDIPSAGYRFPTAGSSGCLPCLVFANKIKPRRIWRPRASLMRGQLSPQMAIFLSPSLFTSKVSLPPSTHWATRVKSPRSDCLCHSRLWTAASSRISPAATASIANIATLCTLAGHV